MPHRRQAFVRRTPSEQPATGNRQIIYSLPYQISFCRKNSQIHRRLIVVTSLDAMQMIMVGRSDTAPDVECVNCDG